MLSFVVSPYYGVTRDVGMESTSCRTETTHGPSMFICAINALLLVFLFPPVITTFIIVDYYYFNFLNIVVVVVFSE